MKRNLPAAAAAAAALALSPAAAFSSRELVELCPAVGIAKDAKAHTYYPGGAPGRSARAYNHIAVILAASATCREDGNGNMVADVVVEYAIETGTLFRGAAESTVYAAVLLNGSEIARETAMRSVTLEGDGKQMVVADTVRGVMIGDDDVAEAPDLAIAVGFVK